MGRRRAQRCRLHSGRRGGPSRLVSAVQCSGGRGKGEAAKRSETRRERRGCSRRAMGEERTGQSRTGREVVRVKVGPEGRQRSSKQQWAVVGLVSPRERRGLFEQVQMQAWVQGAGQGSSAIELPCAVYLPNRQRQRTTSIRTRAHRRGRRGMARLRAWKGTIAAVDEGGQKKPWKVR